MVSIIDKIMSIVGLRLLAQQPRSARSKSPSDKAIQVEQRDEITDLGSVNQGGLS